MRAKVSARVVHNRRALGMLTLFQADALNAQARAVVEAARPPDSPLDPYPAGEGLPKQGGWGTWVEGQKVAGGSLRGPQPKKPRGLPRDGIAAVAGFGFPARLVELGTVHTRPQPFLTDAVNRVLPGSVVAISKDIRRRLAGVRDTTVSDRIAAARAAKEERANAAAVAASPDLMAVLRDAAAERGVSGE